MSTRLRHTAARLLAPAGAFRGWRRVTRRAPRILLLGHHRVLPLPDENAFRGDPELVSATPEEFAWQVDYLARHFEPVSCARVAAALDGGPSLPPDAVAITFDDAFSDLAQYAIPILHAARVPATVFVPTDYVGTPRPFWFDLVAQVFRVAPERAIHIAPMHEPMPGGAAPADRARAAYVVLKRLKQCPDAERLAFLETLESKHADIVAAARDGLGRAMSWDEMREAMSHGIEIGAHSASHPCLANIAVSRLAHEITEPRRLIESELGTPCVSFAYPFGGTASYTPAVVAAVRDAGYRVGVSYVPGADDVPPPDRFTLRRQHVERYTTRHYFEALVTLPRQFT